MVSGIPMFHGELQVLIWTVYSFTKLIFLGFRILAWIPKVNLDCEFLIGIDVPTGILKSQFGLCIPCPN